jgi:ATP-dependent DNA helicase UvrD/PcrA
MDILTGLNSVQRKAVKLVDGPILVLAGPGSGKTRVLTHRVAYIIHECRISPYNILAVTFTNKAAREMRARLDRIIGDDASSLGKERSAYYDEQRRDDVAPNRTRELTIGTFHATCARFLRRDGQRVGLDRGFVIYDDEDQNVLMKQIIKELNLNDKMYRPGAVLGAIGKAKDELIGPDDYVAPTYWHEAVGRAYKRYQKLLEQNNAVDFDDLIMRTVSLLRDNSDVLARYQERFRYLHVDEFQDTNIAQYVLMKLLADKYQNLFCVGDEDQSIYAFRGADFRNVLRFRDDFPNARVFLLEQNYRSTQTIIDVAQAVIRKNTTRHEKNLWTENARGIPVTLFEAYNEEEEAQFVVDEINRLTRQGYAPKDCAVFYRTNAQSRSLEEAFVRRSMPYKLVGATRFYQRREVKDMLAYLRLAYNPNDTMALTRVLNVPPRGIGKRTMEELQQWSERLEVSKYGLLKTLTEDGGPKIDSSSVGRQPSFDARTRKALQKFTGMIDEMSKTSDGGKLVDLFDSILQKTDYEGYLRDGTREGADRWANVLELRNVTNEYAEDIATTLPQFLEEVALVADIDTLDESVDAPTLMTLHTAKGLEYRAVFIVGLEEGLFPHSRSLEDPAQMEEERRLFYVGITRAKERLYLLYAFRRTSFGSSEVNDPSRYLEDIPRELIAGSSARETRGTGTGARRGAAAQSGWGDAATWGHGDAPKRPVVRFIPAATRYKAGDKVRHPMFGVGIVVTSRATGQDDEEVEVAFEGKGVKKLLASLAGLEKR